MNNRLNTLLFIASSTLLLASCSEDNTSFETPNASGTVTNSGVISQRNFSLLTADINPAVIDATTGTFTKTDVEVTVYIGDRNNQTLTDAHTISFKTGYGLIEPSCVTEGGSCSVTWSAINRPVAGGPGSDGFVRITAYTIGEEGFIDANGNNLFDDADGTAFGDLEEPFVDVNGSTVFDAGDIVIDTVSTNDPTGANNTHDIADGFFNGPGCTHTSLCSTAKSVTIFDSVRMNLITNIPLERTIGGDVIGLTGTGLQLLNNSETLSITANGAYTFPTTVPDGSTYAVSVSTQPTTPGQICTVANETGTVSANVSTVDVTCATNTYTVGGGTITNLLGTGLQLQNGTEILDVANTDTAYTFATPVNDGATYAVSVATEPTGPNQTCLIANNSGTINAADVTNADISCTTTQYTIGATITGSSITGGQSITIQNNSGDDIIINDGDPLTVVFGTAIDDGTGYGVTVSTPPATNTNCTVTNPSGTVAGANVTNVSIDCIP